MLVALLILASGVPVGAQQNGAAVGAEAPAFELERLDGEADTMKSVGRIIGEFRRLRIAKSRYSALAEREAALLQDHLGSVFVEAAFLRGVPLDYDGYDAEVYVDEIGVGRGVSDRLRELNYVVKPFNASKRATTEARQFTYANLRSPSGRYWSALI
jgi:hypothetical protein